MWTRFFRWLAGTHPIAASSEPERDLIILQMSSPYFVTGLPISRR